MIASSYLFHKPYGGISMVRAPSYHLTARAVEDDHSVDAMGFLVEGEEVANPQIMGNDNTADP
jgi:hypothetical protein